MRIALIDADVTAFTSSVVSEKAIDWGDGIWTLHSEIDEGQRIFRESIHRIQERVEADKVVLAFSDKENWRKEILPTYKANRAGTRQPLIRQALVEWAKEEYESVTKPTLEGDDVLGIIATRKSKDTHIICTIDKDLKTIPGLHYNITHDNLFEVTEEEADRWHLVQALAGDPTDGYDGCPGVGMERAIAFLEDPHILVPYEHTLLRGPRKGEVEIRYRNEPLGGRSVWEAIVSQYEKAGFGEEEALTQARVARICRAEDYDFKKKQVILWTPNSK